MQALEDNPIDFNLFFFPELTFQEEEWEGEPKDSVPQFAGLSPFENDLFTSNLYPDD